MRLIRMIVAAVVFGGLAVGCAKDSKPTVPVPSADDKPLGNPSPPGAGPKQRKAG